MVNEVVMDPWASPAPSGTWWLRNSSRDPGSAEYSLFAANEGDDYLLKRAFSIADAKLTALGIRHQVKLFACDYANEEMGASKADKFFTLIQSWVSAGVPIDGVAFQLHLSLQYYPPNYTKIRDNISRFKSLKTGFEVHFSEIDVRVQISDGISETEKSNHAAVYGELMAVCLDFPEVNSFITWGITDKYSWIPATFTGYGYGLVFDESYQPKACYEAMKKSF